MIKIEICGTSARCIQPMLLTAGLVGAQVEFAFDEVWDGLSRCAVFTDGVVTKDVLLGEEGRCVIPHEVLTEVGRELQVGVYGADADGDVVIPTVFVNLGAIRHGVSPAGDESYPPTPDVVAQLMQRIEAAENSGGSGGTGAVQSVNGKTGCVELTAEDVGAMAADAVFPEKLPNPCKLTFSGAVEAEYDGSETVEVMIPQGGSGGDGNANFTLAQTVSITEAVNGIAVDLGGTYNELWLYFDGVKADVSAQLCICINAQNAYTNGISSANGQLATSSKYVVVHLVRLAGMNRIYREDTDHGTYGFWQSGTVTRRYADDSSEGISSLYIGVSNPTTANYTAGTIKIWGR